MLTVIAVILSVVFLGFIKPYKTAWAILLLVPLFGPGGFYIGVESFLPLNAYRIGFFALFAILIKLRINIIQTVYKYKFTRVIVLYFIVIFLLQIKDYFMPTAFTMMPFYALAVFVPFVIIKTKKDLYKIATIFTFQAFFIGFFVLVEYYTDFSLSVFIRQFSGVDLSTLQTKGGGAEEIFRSGFYRVAGLHGNSVQTAFHLVFLFPFTLFYWQYEKNLTRFIPLLLTLGAFIFLQTRAAMIVLVVMILLIIFLTIRKRHLNKTAIKIIWMSIIISGLIFIISLFTPQIFDIAEKFILGIVSVITNDPNSIEGNVTEKLDRIPLALKFIYSSPVYGYIVSPRYAYSEIMMSDDLPSIFLHLIGGGILLGGLLIILMFKLIRGTFKELNNIQSQKFKDLILYSTVATFGGFLVTFSNMAEEHYLSIFLMFVAIKYFVSIQKYYPIKKGLVEKTY
jgi:hypothetical protein